MQKTNTLHVYLLTKPYYFNLVPGDTHEGLAILFDYFSNNEKRNVVTLVSCCEANLTVKKSTGSKNYLAMDQVFPPVLKEKQVAWHLLAG